MTTWLVEYFPHVKSDPDSPELREEIPCYRIFPEHEPERWVVQTNPELTQTTQEEFALLIADALSKLLM
jgi:hypothetical protein